MALQSNRQDLDPQENYKQELETENIALSEVVK
jgi:hypothetical protein